jgi:hypothetical protein
VVVPTVVPMVHRQAVETAPLASPTLVGSSPLLLGHRLRLPAAGVPGGPDGVHVPDVDVLRSLLLVAVVTAASGRPTLNT